MDPYTVLIPFLRNGHEHVKIAIECEATESEIPSSISERSEGASVVKTGLVERPRAGGETKCIVALVTNVEQGFEEGCIFLFKRRNRDPSLVKVIDGLPIVPGFQASVQQVPRTLSPSERVSGPSSSLKITMSLAAKTISAVSDDTQAVTDFMKVVREADIVIRGQSESGRRTHEWVERYMDVGWNGAIDFVPIFSRFSRSSFASSAAAVRRPRAPSPNADQLSLSFGTFNVNNQVPSATDDLSIWLKVAQDDPDILIVGLQEVDSSGMSYVIWTPRVEATWTEAIERSMQRNSSEYTRLACKQLVGVIMFIYVRTNLLCRISMPSMASVGIGFGGWLANKGAVAIRFVLDKTSLCFVVSHLSAFHTPEGRERRRWDYHEIVKRLKFVIVTPSAEPLAKLTEGGEEDDDEKHSLAEQMLRRQLNRSSALSTEGGADVEKKMDDNIADTSNDEIKLQHWQILDHDIVIWGGDLNFRIELNELDTKRLIRKGQYRDTLFKFDQLQSEMSAQACFSGFREHVVDFAPTYKFDRGTDTYDTSEKHRNPAWTDRILWRTCDQSQQEAGVSAAQVQPIIYESAPQLRLSDHKPVYALFQLTL